MKASKDLRRKTSKVLEQHPTRDISIVEYNDGRLWMEINDIMAYPMKVVNHE